MVRACVDLKFSIHSVPQFRLGQHTTHRALDDPNRPALAHVPRTVNPKTTRVSTVVPVKLLIFLTTGEPNSFGVDNDDVIADVKEWRVAGFVLTLKQLGRFACYSTQNTRVRIDDEPASFDICFRWYERCHIGERDTLPPLRRKP